MKEKKPLHINKQCRSPWLGHSFLPDLTNLLRGLFFLPKKRGRWSSYFYPWDPCCTFLCKADPTDPLGMVPAAARASCHHPFHQQHRPKHHRRGPPPASARAPLHRPSPNSTGPFTNTKGRCVHEKK